MNISNTIRVLLVDDQPLIREGLKAIIERQLDMEVVGEAEDGNAALDAYQSLQPDVMILDVKMPQMSGPEALVEVRNRFPSAKIIMLTIYETDEDIFRCVRAGAAAFLLKDVPQQQLMKTIRTVAAGHTDITATVAAKLATRLNSAELSRRETEVLHLMAGGCSNLEIAGELFISEGTVKSHVNSILSKMRVTDRTQAVTQAVKRGLVVL